MSERPDSMAYSVDEAFEIAEQIERNGAAFYRKAAEGAGTEETKKIFEDLALREDDHEKIFAGLRKKLVPASDSVDSYDNDELVASYLKAIAGKYVFNVQQEPDDMFTSESSAADVLKSAIQKEKDSIILYVGMKQALKDEDMRDKIGFIMREEQRHLVDLSRMLNQMGA